MSAKGKTEKMKPDNPSAQKLHDKASNPNQKVVEGDGEESQQEPLTYRTICPSDELVWQWKAALKSKGLVELAQEEEEWVKKLASCKANEVESVALNLWCVVFLRESYLVVTPSRAVSNARLKVARLCKERTSVT